MSSWLVVELTVPAEQAEAIEQALEELGVLAISLSDPGGEPVLEPAPGATPLWKDVIISALFPAEAHAETIADAVRLRLAALGVPPARVAIGSLAERDWIREFRENLQPLRFGAQLWLCPSGHICPDPAGIRVELEPGLAFGSGSHPTTAMCLEWLTTLDLRGRAVLDWGCGSGVLAIAALALGARSALGVDIDRQALQASSENAARNGCAARLDLVEPAFVAAAARFDVVVANILADSLIALAPVLRSHCASGASVALSGILAAQAERVRRACAPSLVLDVAAESGGWVLLTGTAAGGEPLLS